MKKEKESIMKLPVIDFSNVEQESWEYVKKQVMEALQEYGCFEAVFHDQIPPHLRKSLFDVLQQLFDLPLQNKARNLSGKAFLGYIGQVAHFPLYESLGIDDALSPGKIEAFANLMWSEQGNPTFSKSVSAISEKMIELDNIVRTMVVESLGLQKYMDEHMDTTKYEVRIQKYDRRPDQTDEVKLSLPPHADATVITVLYQDDVNGLEVVTKDGHWFNVDPSPGSFVVMIGVTLQAWTNGRLKAPYHRVMMRGDKTRCSIGTFSIPKAERIVTVPVEMVDEEHPLLYKPFDYVKYLEFLYSEAARTSLNPLKDYCGV